MGCCRYNDPGVKEFLDICSFLDPRVKSLVYLSAVQCAKVKDDVIRMIVSKSSEDISSYKSNSAVDSQTQSCLLGSILGDDYSQATSSDFDFERMIQLEVNQYCKDGTCSMDSSPLLW